MVTFIPTFVYSYFVIKIQRFYHHCDTHTPWFPGVRIDVGTNISSKTKKKKYKAKQLFDQHIHTRQCIWQSFWTYFIKLILFIVMYIISGWCYKLHFCCCYIYFRPQNHSYLPRLIYPCIQSIFVQYIYDWIESNIKWKYEKNVS